ncbi:MAG: hypothetical protein PHW76_02760, partial [Alphaproteobacteria bacterium]|nr:hypothetical protein [Alphaproteobacteria bacterium]
MNLMLSKADVSTAVPLRTPEDTASCILQAAEQILLSLEKGVLIEAKILRLAMEVAFGGSDAEGLCTWKTAYEVCEAAQVLFLRKYGRAMQSRTVTPAALLSMIAKIAELLPTHTRRTQESEALQQFSTPVPLGLIASIAAGITQNDVVLEPSAGTGMLAVFAEIAGARLALNEIADVRAALLKRLFPDAVLSMHDAATIHDRLDAEVKPSVVLMNPPFSAALHVAQRMQDSAFRHIASAFVRLAQGGRLVAITGANVGPDNPAWRAAFVELQEKGGHVRFSCAIDGSVYAKHGTIFDTRLTVIDKLPTADANSLPSSMSAATVAELLTHVAAHLPPRSAVSGPVGILEATKPNVAIKAVSPLAIKPQIAVVSAAPVAIELGYEPVTETSVPQRA